MASVSIVADVPSPTGVSGISGIAAVNSVPMLLLSSKHLLAFMLLTFTAVISLLLLLAYLLLLKFECCFWRS